MEVPGAFPAPVGALAECYRVVVSGLRERALASAAAWCVPRNDCGSKLDFLQASIECNFKRPELGAELCTA